MAMALFMVTTIEARRRSRRQGGITQALQKSLPSADDPFVNEPIQVASIDKISLSFDERTKEIPLDPLKDQSVPEEAKIAKKTTTKQSQGYVLPIELRKEAEKELEKVEKPLEEEEKIELQFEDADLQTFVEQIAHLFDVTFISDEAIDPLPKGTSDSPTKALKGNKITFKTSSPVTRQQAWNLFITFLSVAGFGIVQQPDPTIYRIEAIKATQKAPLPTFIGVNYETLPETDELIRYLYFIENATIESMLDIVKSLQSSAAAAPIFLKDQKAFLLTDKSYNIRSLMKIIKELDKVTMPQAMSVLKLREADAVEVKKLYDELTQQGEDRSPFRPFGARKQPTAIYFPENARIIAEPRTNSLILLGSQDAISKIEDFIVKHVDVALDQPYSPLYTYQLQYADAKTVAEIMNKTTKLGKETEAGKSGGVRGQDKYLRNMAFTPEPKTNKLIIKGDYDDYLIAKEIIQKLDEPQPQVAIEVLILSVELIDTKELGTQIRSKVANNIPGLDGLLGKNVAFQTSGLRAGGPPSPIVTNNTGAGVTRLLGNLLNLVTNAGVANTIVTFGQDVFGVWGLFQALRTITNLQVISNPFLVASNKTPAKISLGETRRIVSGTIISGPQTSEDTFENDEAALKVNIEPQINSDGMIVLKLRVELTEFTDASDASSGQKTTKLVETNAIVSDREVLALGGLIRNTIKENLSKVPILADIPVLGWLFKNKRKSVDKDSLLILISTKIIPPHEISEVNKFTQERLKYYRNEMGDMAQADTPMDPIHKLFFSEDTDKTRDIGEFLFERHQQTQRKGRRRRRRTQKQAPTQSEQQPAVTVAQSPTLHTIAAPSQPIADKPTTNAIAKNEATPALLQSKRRRSRSLSTYLSTNDSEKTV